MTRRKAAGRGTEIADFGEKIGGARKDRAVKTGPKRKKAEQAAEGPAWARRYLPVQNMKTGKWDLLDIGKSGRYGGHPSIARDLASEADAKAAIPLAAVSRNHRVRATSDGKFQIWREVTDRKRVQVVNETFATRDDAMRHMAQNARKIIETKTSFGEEIFVKPEKVYRKGPEARPGNIAGDAFLKKFGFRGVEFGNWQTERQSVMNHAYDAMRDLEHITGIAPKSLSLGGELGLAFGARGNGGKEAARAHYERDYGAINLTKMQGAGTLAHEWWHAADHFLGRLDDPKLAERIERGGDKVFKTAGRETDYASQRVGGYYKGQMPDAVRAAYKELMDAMLLKPEQYTEDATKAQKFAEGTSTELKKRIDDIRRDLATERTYGKRNTKPASAAQIAEFDKLASKITSGEALKTDWKAEPNPKARSRFGVSRRFTNDTLDAISSIYKQVRGRSGFDSQDMRGPLNEVANAMQRHEKRLAMLADAAAQSVKTKMIPTEFAREARKLDEGRVGDYWQTKHEMAARAFSAYVEDKLAAQGRRSDYLSYGSDNKFYKMLGMSPFPEGPERAAINAKFDKLFEAMKRADVVRPAVPMGMARAMPPTNDVREAMKSAPSNERTIPNGMPETAHETVRGVPTEIRPGANGDPFKYKSKWHETVEWDEKGYPGKTTVVHAATLAEYEAKLREIDAARVKAGQQPRHVWDDAARAASAEARTAKADPSTMSAVERAIARSNESAAKMAKQGPQLLPAVEKYETLPNGDKRYTAAHAKKILADAKAIPTTDPTRNLKIEHAKILASTAWRPDGSAYVPALYEAANADLKAQQAAAAAQTTRGKRKVKVTPQVAPVTGTAPSADPTPWEKLVAETEVAKVKRIAAGGSKSRRRGDDTTKPTAYQKSLQNERQSAGPENIPAKAQDGKPFTSKGRGQLLEEARKRGLKAFASLNTRTLASRLGYRLTYAVPLIAAPVTAAILAYDAKKSEAQAAGAMPGSTPGSAVAAGAIAGGTTAAIGYGIAKGMTWAVRGAAAAGAAVGAPVLGTAAAVGVTALGVGMMAHGAYKGYQRHGAKGAVLGAVGAEGLLDRKPAELVTPVNGRLSEPQKAQFATANAAYEAMRQQPNASVPLVTEQGRGWANIKVQRAAQQAKGRVYDPARKIEPHA